MSKSEEDFVASVQLLDATLKLYEKGLKDAIVLWPQNYESFYATETHYYQESGQTFTSINFIGLKYWKAVPR